ncbi:hypothetical protein TOC8171_33290 [Pseudomonas syringae]
MKFRVQAFEKINARATQDVIIGINIAASPPNLTTTTPKPIFEKMTPISADAATTDEDVPTSA